MSLMITTLPPDILPEVPKPGRRARQPGSMSTPLSMHLWSWVCRRVEAAARECAMRRARRELMAMPDSLLKDIGVARGEIDGAISTGRITRP